MKLISSLLVGFARAPLGTARLVRRGTSTAVTVYQDFEGNATFPSGNLSLDVNGSVTAYVNEVVDITVYDATGTSVAEFTEGDAAPNVEVRSSSFTGADYDTATSAASNPTTLQEVLDLWKDQNGAIDWQVLVNGSALTVAAAVAGLAGLFFNVKDPAYGAKGDGVADDTTPVQNTITAAGIGGGVVFFPPGTYRITDALTGIANKVSLLGCGPRVSVIKLDAGTSYALTVVGSPGGTTGTNFVRDLGFSLVQSTTESLVYINTSTNIAFERCAFTPSPYTADCLVELGASATGNIEFHQCDFQIAGVTGKGIVYGVAASAKLFVDGGRFKAPASFGGRCISADRGVIRGVLFDNTAVTVSSAGFYNVYQAAAGADGMLVSGCIFTDLGGAVGGTACALSGIADGALNVEGCLISDDLTVTLGKQSTSASLAVGWAQRDFRHTTVADDGATVTVDLNQYGAVTLTRTVNSQFTLAATSAPPHAGMRALVTVRNTNGANMTDQILPGTNFDNIRPGDPPWSLVPVIPAGYSIHMLFISNLTVAGTVFKWCLAGVSVGSPF